MIYLNAFLFAGFICMLGQIILDNSKLTPGHITSIFTVVGALLSFFEIYPSLVEKCGIGATSLIMNFGNMLFLGGMEGFENSGLIGIFSGLLCKSSLAITGAIVFAFIITIFCKPKN